MTGLNQKVSGLAVLLCIKNTWASEPPADRQNLTQHLYVKRNLVSPYHCPKGKRTVRKAFSDAGKGWRRKRMPLCNGSDRGSNFASI
ncbi:hypothetical protein DVF23_23235 [Salmonella enterica subsp. enterica serovar Teko]|nr:hypothetical protein [Salmonella enterica subsp. enterica serovar Teko]